MYLNVLNENLDSVGTVELVDGLDTSVQDFILSWSPDEIVEVDAIEDIDITEPYIYQIGSRYYSNSETADYWEAISADKLLWDSLELELKEKLEEIEDNLYDVFMHALDIYPTEDRNSDIYRLLMQEYDLDENDLEVYVRKNKEVVEDLLRTVE